MTMFESTVCVATAEAHDPQLVTIRLAFPDAGGGFDATVEGRVTAQVRCDEQGNFPTEGLPNWLAQCLRDTIAKVM